LDGWTWEDMEIKPHRRDAHHFSDVGRRTGGSGRRWWRRSGGSAAQFGLAPGAGTFTEAKRQYDLQIQKLNDFFDGRTEVQERQSGEHAGLSSRT
jgi:hypothetical protein